MKSEKQVVTTEELLKKFREGYKDCELTYGSFTCPIRPLNADEENQIILKVRNMPVPNEAVREQTHALETMKAVLAASANVNGTPHLSRQFLDQLTSSEIEKLYDQYIEKCHQVNPEFEDIGYEKVAEMIADVKKNNAKASEYTTMQLKAIGLYFLEEILPMVKEHGSK